MAEVEFGSSGRRVTSEQGGSTRGWSRAVCCAPAPRAACPAGPVPGSAPRLLGESGGSEPLLCVHTCAKDRTKDASRLCVRPCVCASWTPVLSDRVRLEPARGRVRVEPGMALGGPSGMSSIGSGSVGPGWRAVNSGDRLYDGPESSSADSRRSDRGHRGGHARTRPQPPGPGQGP